MLADLASIQHMIHIYGLWVVFIMVALESAGVPIPGETALVTAAIYAGATHHLHIADVVAVAGFAAVMGDNLGYVIGRTIGLRLLKTHGPRMHLTEGRLVIGQYLFLRHGGKIVFFGRFLAFLRTFAALLAGANRMDWRRFFIMNGAGGAVWALLFGGGAYLFGDRLRAVSGPVSGVALALVVIGIIACALLFRRFERQLEAHARAAIG